jgi:hypothetical protein
MTNIEYQNMTKEEKESLWKENRRYLDALHKKEEELRAKSPSPVFYYNAPKQSIIKTLCTILCYIILIPMLLFSGIGAIYLGVWIAGSFFSPKSTPDVR